MEKAMLQSGRMEEYLPKAIYLAGFGNIRSEKVITRLPLSWSLTINVILRSFPLLLSFLGGSIMVH